MNLRTPRRRISPRTRRRYRAIREFFRRALGSPSQPDIKISSSIAVNVTDLKRKIVGLEQQLDEVNKHCQNITSLDCTRRESESYLQPDAQYEKGSNCDITPEINREKEATTEPTEPSYESKLNGTETKFLYKSSIGKCVKSSNGQCGKSQASEYHSKIQDVVYATQGMLEDDEEHVPKVKNKKSKLHRLSDYGAKLHKYRTRSVYENFASSNSTSSFRSLINPRLHHSNPGYSSRPNDNMKYLKQEYAEPLPPQYYKEKKYTERSKRSKNDKHKECYEQKPIKTRKPKHQNRELDQDFIADIIRRQYRPVKMFGRRESDLSQISAPVCRDQEFSIREDIQEGTELCSCCYDGKKHKRIHSDLSEMRSICDTRLYSNKRHTRGKRCRVHRDMFNNSDVYDLIPVKEKSSPKTRRKFAKDNMLPYEYYREVPPSPRTLRPRLNLKSQHNTDFEDYMAHVKHTRMGSPYRRRYQRERVQLDSDVTSLQVPNVIVEQPRKSSKRLSCHVEKLGHCQQDNATMSSLQGVPCANDQVTVTADTTFAKTDETREEIPVDKTDKALCEIKDILQSFLQEIKKETATSQCDKFEDAKTEDNGTSNENTTKLNDSVIPNSRHSLNNFGVGYGASPFMSSFQNPCCYPVMPMCPMSYPNGYMIPSPSYTCANCVNAAKEPAQNEHCCNKNAATTCHSRETSHTETENLIKEIYKFVAQGPVKKKAYESSIDRHERKTTEAKMLTSRSVGDSSRLSKHDANVGTPPLKCYSKSCEAIGGSRMSSDAYNNSATNASYSDTILEKLSLQVTQSTSETEIDTTITDDKSKRKMFSNVLRSIGILKKKKKDVIEELSESGSAIDVEVRPRSPRASYRQEITNYMMHGQEYYHPPPVTSHYRRPNEYQPDYNPPYNPGLLDYSQPPPPPPPPPLHDIYAPRAQHSRMRQQASAPPYPSKQRPTAPPFHSSYDNPYKQQPQVPLCLREIEVKSIGTQSERKMSIFRKFQKKIQPPEVESYQNTCSTQTQASPGTKAAPRLLTKPLINWKKLQAKAMADHDNRDMDPMKFSLKTEKELAMGDLKLRNAMLKKLFYKRNPFSPRNLIVRTLLGKDKSSFGNPPPGKLRPRMFL